MECLPEPVANSLRELIANLRINLVVCPPRKTKLGDWMFRGGVHTIHINNNLCPEQFFITLVHEIAHATTWNKYHGTVKPHGAEWKQEFRNHMLPLLVGHFSPEIETYLREHMKNPAASSCTKIEMVRVLNPEQTLLEDVPMGVSFKLKTGLLLQKVHKRRTKWLCREPLSGKEWLVPGRSPVF